jgi:hypothetical protein
MEYVKGRALRKLAQLLHSTEVPANHLIGT